MTKVVLKCRDYDSDGETMAIDCDLNDRGYINFDEGPDGVATEGGENYEFELDATGTIDFGREYEGDRLWQTDLHQLRMQPGVCVKVVAGGPVWTYEVVSVR